MKHHTPALVAPPPPTLVERALAPGEIHPVYQPIFASANGELFAHEALMRFRSLDATPNMLLAEARHQGRLGEVEAAAARMAASHFDPACEGLLFINFSRHAFLQGQVRPQQVLRTLLDSGLDLRRCVIELTERDVVEDCAALARSLAYLRARGVRVALDDFGAGTSNFELWHELSPDFIKIDRLLIDGIATGATRLAMVKAIVDVANELGTEVIAEGVEREGVLAMAKELGIGYVQGYLLGRPAARLCTGPSETIAALETRVPVRPAPTWRDNPHHIKAGHLLVEAPALTRQNVNEDAEHLFRANPGLHALAVVDEAERPIGLINRRDFSEEMGRQFARELSGRKSCATWMRQRPIVCETSNGMADLADILRGDDQRYLTDGFVITEDGRYRGLGTAEALVRSVTELRIEAARYANALTLLPGNIPITEHIGRLLEARVAFAVAYGDLNHFKPFNDQYGYFRGDHMIRLAADVHREHLDPALDFLGHVGGDDFVAVFQSQDWRERCDRIVADFNQRALKLYDPGDELAGSITGEDRSGRPATFPLSTLSIGSAWVQPGQFATPEQVASAAATAKRRAKRENLGVYELSAREIGALADAAAAA